MNRFDHLEERILRHIHNKGTPLTTSEIACALEEHIIMVQTALGCLNRERKVVRINWDGMHYWMEKGA